MERQEYLQRQQELRERRGEANRIHREKLDLLEQEHQQNCSKERQRYLKAKREQKNSYDQTVFAIEREQQTLKTLWYEKASRMSDERMEREFAKTNTGKSTGMRLW